MGVQDLRFCIKAYDLMMNSRYFVLTPISAHCFVGCFGAMFGDNSCSFMLDAVPDNLVGFM